MFYKFKVTRKYKIHFYTANENIDLADTAVHIILFSFYRHYKIVYNPQRCLGIPVIKKEIFMVTSFVLITN